MKDLRFNPKGRCARCGGPVFYRDNFCKTCGSENSDWYETEEGQCGNCHERLQDGDAYCRYCGTKAGEGAFEPYQNFHACIYGPAPERRYHECHSCGFSWSTFTMVDKQNYCPKCGASVTCRVEEPVVCLTLTELEDPSKQYEVLLTKEVVIGRGSTADLKISENRYISREHCMVYQMNGAYYIKDLESKNHTLYDGKILEHGESVQLGTGMILEMGGQEYRVSLRMQ